MLPIGLGCMRLEDDAVITAAIALGVEWLDTAHAYEGSEERIARVAPEARVVTKVGMTRPGGAWVVDGRARTILEQARESKARLGRAPDILMLHAPDPDVGLATSVRALVKAREEGLAHAIGLSNPSRRDLDDLADVGLAAIEIALGPKHDATARAGMLEWCKARGVRVFAHSPLGGPAHAPKLAKDAALSAMARRHAVTAAEVMLAYLLALGPQVVPIPGVRRVESVASLARASALVLGEEDLALLDARFPGLGAARRPISPPANPTAEVVLVMGVAGAGKSTLMARFEGYERLNRDLLGGTLAGIAKRLEAMLASGVKRIVLDNTYTSRAARSDVVRVAHRAGAAVRCIHIDIPLADARINVVNRMLDRHGALLGVKEFRTKKDPNLLGPTTLATMFRQVERPAVDEGFASIETIGFARTPGTGRAGAAVPLEQLDALASVPPEVPVLVFGWNADEAAVRAKVAAAGRTSDVEVLVCPHPDGPPACWCRPPLPGLWLAFARKYGVDPRASTMFASSPVHRTMANELGMKVR